MYAFLFASILLFTGSASEAVCPKIKTTISETICKGDFYYTTNNTYTTSGVYFDTIKTGLGCDSIVEIKLSVYEVKTQGLVKQSICQGDSIYWAGIYRKSAGDYIEKNTNFYGCDSTTLLKLTVNKSPRKDTSIKLCNGNLFSDDQYTFEKTGKYVLRYSTKSECDSIVNLDLKINPTYSKSIDVSICENTSVRYGNVVLDNAGIYYDSLKSIRYGCDSVLEYNVRVIIPPAKPEIVIKLPDSLFTQEYGSTYVWLLDKVKLTANTQRIKAQKNGSYKVIAYLEGKCPSDTSDAFNCNTIITSNETITVKEELEIYPNPANNHIILVGKNTLGKIQLLDNTGKIVNEYYTNLNKIELPLAAIKAGNYYLMLTGANKKIKIVH